MTPERASLLSAMVLGGGGGGGGGGGSSYLSRIKAHINLIAFKLFFLDSGSVWLSVLEHSQGSGKVGSLKCLHHHHRDKETREERFVRCV